MTPRSARVAVTALVVLLFAARADLALAINDSTSFNNTSQSITTGTWGVIAGSNAAAGATGSAYGPITPYNSSCVATDFYLTTDTNGWTASDKRVGLQQSTSQLTVGMTVTGVGIFNSGINTIASLLPSNRVILTLGPNTSPSNTTLKFSIPCATISGSKYFNIINTGTIDLISINIQQTVNTTAGKAIDIQTCGATWDELSDTCSGTITTIMTTIGSGAGANSPQTVAWTITIAAGGSIRVRALSTELGKTSTVSVWVTNANIRAGVDTNS